MSALAPTLQAYFTERLMNQLQASGHTVAGYRDAFRLLLAFASQRSGKAPSALGFEDLDAAMIAAFLDHLERDRGNCARTRNGRLAAVHSLFRFAALRHPEHAELIARVLAIPSKRFDHAEVAYLTREGSEALLGAADRSRWIGRRDHALLSVALQTGLRVSELTGLCCQDVELARGAHVRCQGKGRKARCTPLTSEIVTILGEWMRERNGQPSDPLFPTSRGRRLSRDAVSLLLTKYADIARSRCPTLQGKSITPHVLRHSAAMALLHAGVDSTVIALWLGHEQTRTTEIYIHADLTLKERALARTAPPGTTPGRYRAPDALLAFLEGL